MTEIAGATERCPKVRGVKIREIKRQEGRVMLGRLFIAIIFSVWQDVGGWGFKNVYGMKGAKSKGKQALASWRFKKMFMEKERSHNEMPWPGHAILETR